MDTEGKKSGVKIDKVQRIVTLIAAIVALISVLGAFWGNLKGYIITRAYFSYFMIDMKNVDINYFYDAKDMIISIIVTLMQIAISFSLFDLIRRNASNQRIKHEAANIKGKEIREAALNLFYVNKDRVLDLIDIIAFITLFLGCYFILLVKENDFLVGPRNIWNYQIVLTILWGIFSYLFAFYQIHFCVDETLDMPQIIQQQVNELLDSVQKSDEQLSDIKEAIKDVERISSRERKYAIYRLPITCLLVVVGISVGLMIFTSYYTGVAKAKSQSAFWLDQSEEYVEFQVKEDEYIKMKIDINEDELYLHPEEISFTKITDEDVHKKEFRVVILE